MRQALTGLLVLGAIVLAAPADADTIGSGPLVDYLARADPSYRWVERRSGRVADTEYAELTLTSQTWRGTVWKHQLFIIVPPNARPDTHHALIYVTGGAWKAKYESDDYEDLPKSAPLFAHIAKIVGTPMVILRHVPQQPLFEGRKEDALIALTFENFLRTRESDWPLLLPMVKSVVRSMDAVQAYAAQKWGLEVEKFTVSGASKRGWTTWLTGAADARVAAIAPMVIDVLNFEPHIALQEATFGKPSQEIADYTQLGLHEQLDSDAGRALQAIVDPYNYRHDLTLPKLIIVGTNDQYWPLDSLNLYWDDLEGQKYILYMPNEGHKIRDYHRLAGTLNALHQHVARGQPLPDMRWSFSASGGRLHLRVTSDKKPGRVVAWVATAPTRDFREARWTAQPMTRRGDAYVFELAAPSEGYAAVFGDVQYDRWTLAPSWFCTNVRILGADGLAGAASSPLVSRHQSSSR